MKAFRTSNGAILFLAAASAASVSFLSQARANLIVNGSFEDPSIAGSPFVGYGSGNPSVTGWTIGGSGQNIAIHHSPEIQASADSTFGPAQEGAQYLDLSGGGQPAPIYQDLATTVGNQYALKFYIGASDANPPGLTINVTLASEPGDLAFFNQTYQPNPPTAAPPVGV